MILASSNKILIYEAIIHTLLSQPNSPPCFGNLQAYGLAGFTPSIRLDESL